MTGDWLRENYPAQRAAIDCLLFWASRTSRPALGRSFLYRGVASQALHRHDNSAVNRHFAGGKSSVLNAQIGEEFVSYGSQVEVSVDAPSA
jgi:hypothetical protein